MIHDDTYTCTYAYTNAYAYTYAYPYLYIYIYICIHMHAPINVYLHIHIHLHTHTYIYIYTHSHTYTYMYNYTHTHTHAQICVYMSVYIYTYIIYICTFCYFLPGRLARDVGEPLLAGWLAGSTGCGWLVHAGSKLGLWPAGRLELGFWPAGRLADCEIAGRTKLAMKDRKETRTWLHMHIPVYLHYINKCITCIHSLV